MKSKFSPKWSLLVLGLAGTFLAVLILSFHLPKENFSVQTASVVGQTNLNLPIRLKIPKINIDAVIEQVGITPDGAMDVPKGPDTVAWFNLGPRPGRVGSSVIDGHSGYKNNRPAVFDNLHKLQKGDKIYIEDSKGITATFIVREFRTYGLNDDVSSVFNSNDRAAHLNLVTCSGAWNAKEKTHATRLIVFTDLTP
jgi:LPXTG-site transpeptidase (sortase) family protein